MPKSIYDWQTRLAEEANPIRLEREHGCYGKGSVMGKTRKQSVESTQKREVDENLVKDYAKLTDAGRALAALRTQPNRNVTIAGFTPAQMSAFNSTNGIAGYSTAPEFDKAVRALPSDYSSAVDAFFNQIAGNGGKGEPNKVSSPKPSKANGLKSRNATTPLGSMTKDQFTALSKVANK
jgi:hypothetical protein